MSPENLADLAVRGKRGADSNFFSELFASKIRITMVHSIGKKNWERKEIWEEEQGREF